MTPSHSSFVTLKCSERALKFQSITRCISKICSLYVEHQYTTASTEAIMVSLISFEIESFVKGYHLYQYDWSPKVDEVLKAKIEPTNIVDKYAVCVLLHDRVVGHLK